MKPGEVYMVEVPFSNRPGSKVRPVVVLRTFDDGYFAGAASTSQIKPNLRLLHSVDFSGKRYGEIRKKGLSGVSNFYEKAVKLLPIAPSARLIGMLDDCDFSAIMHGLGLA
jgi:hypothetical protein